MSNYLELTQMVARESGTVPGTQPLTLSGEQPARLQKMANWVNQAWNMIQNHKQSWHWMKAEFQADISQGISRYSGISLGINRLGRFVTTYRTMRIFDPVLGLADESFLVPTDYNYWQRLYGIGEQTQNRPGSFSVIASDQTLALGPTPDKTYTITGEYFKSPQALVVDTDIPEMPERFHNMIVWKALMLLSGHDEGSFAVGNAASQYREYLGNLEREQLPILETARHWRC